MWSDNKFNAMQMLFQTQSSWTSSSLDLNRKYLTFSFLQSQFSLDFSKSKSIEIDNLKAHIDTCQSKENILSYVIQSGDELLEVFFFGTLEIGLGLHLSSGQHFSLLGTSGLLDLALEFLLRLALGVPLGEDGETTQSVDGLVLDEVLLVVVGEGEAGGAVASEGGPESEEDNVLRLPVVLVGDELAEVLLGDVGLALVVDVEEQLAAGQQLVDSETTGLDGDGHFTNNIQQIMCKLIIV